MRKMYCENTINIQEQSWQTTFLERKKKIAMPILIFIPGATSSKIITKGLFHEQNIVPIIFFQVAFYLNRSLDPFLLC